MPDRDRSPALPDCCVRYVRHFMETQIEWAQRVHDLVGGDVEDALGISSYICAMDGRDYQGDPLGLTIRELLDIVEGRRECPWHGNVPENYLAVMDLLRRGVPLELGPIELVEEWRA